MKNETPVSRVLHFGFNFFRIFFILFALSLFLEFVVKIFVVQTDPGKSPFFKVFYKVSPRRAILGYFRKKMFLTFL